MSSCQSINHQTSPPASHTKGTSKISGVVNLPFGHQVNISTNTTKSDPSSDNFFSQKLYVNQNNFNKINSHSSIAGEFIIRTKKNLSAQSVHQLQVSGYQLNRTGGIPQLGIGFYKISQKNTSSQISTQLLTSIKALPQVIHAEANKTFKITNIPNDTYYPIQWNLRYIQTPTTWSTPTEATVTVAVIDTGITQHPDLSAKILPGIDLITDIESAGDGDGIDYDPTDLAHVTNYHGSHVSGIIAANSHNNQGIAGISQNTNILPVRVIGTKGTGTSIDIYKGVAWAAGYKIEGIKTNQNPAQIINMSLAGQHPCSLELQNLFNQLASQGIITVVAAGNKNMHAYQFSPANCHNVITVGATTSNHKRAHYSNYGSRIDIMAPGGQSNQQITIDGDTWPGGILSTVYNHYTQKPDYQFMHGTSMAAPHVTGALALLISLYPNLSYQQIIEYLKSSAQPITCDYTDGCGAGHLNITKLLKLPSIAPYPNSNPQQQTIYVTAIPQKENGTYDFSLSQTKRISFHQDHAFFELSKLTQGLYKVFSFIDLNQNHQYDNGEPYGNYPSIINLSKHQHLSDLQIQLHSFDQKSARQ